MCNHDRFDKYTGIFFSGSLKVSPGYKEEGRLNLSYLPSLLKAGLLGFVRLLKKSSNWNAWGDVSLGRKTEKLTFWPSPNQLFISQTFGLKQFTIINVTLIKSIWTIRVGRKSDVSRSLLDYSHNRCTFPATKEWDMYVHLTDILQSDVMCRDVRICCSFYPNALLSGRFVWALIPGGMTRTSVISTPQGKRTTSTLVWGPINTTQTHG